MAEAVTCASVVNRALETERARDHDPLDFGGALADPQNAMIAVEPFDGRVVHQAVASVDLDGGVGDLTGHLGAVELGHGRLCRVAAAVSDRQAA